MYPARNYGLAATPGEDQSRRVRLPLDLFFAGLALALSGCGSISDATGAVRDRIANRDESRARSYPAAQRVTYDAVRIAAQQMGYRMVRGGAAQGQFEAVSGIGRGEGVGSRQLALKARLEPNPEGGTQVTVRITEILERDPTHRPGQATETPLRDSPQYEVFFRAVEQALKDPAPR